MNHEMMEFLFYTTVIFVYTILLMRACWMLFIVRGDPLKAITPKMPKLFKKAKGIGSQGVS